MQTPAYRRYLLALLMTILAFAFVDRVALGLLLQDIKVDLQLSDTQLGVLSGIAFALFYSVMGIPIARWADRGNRVVIITLTTALWSVAVALSGMAGTFTQLMLIRIGVAVGEAGAFPCGISLIADYYSRGERPRAVAIYTMGGPLAVMSGFLLAGWLSQLFGWRATFTMIGAPGLLLAGLSWFSLREPRLLNARSAAESSSALARVEKQSDLREVCATLWANTTFRHLLLCFSAWFFFIYGNFQWQPSYFIRSFGLENWQVGAAFAAIFGIGGLLATYLGGELASRYAAGNERLQLVSFAIVMIGCGVLSTFLYLTPNVHAAFGFLGATCVGLYVGNGPLYAIIQTLAPPGMRAVAMALVMLCANLIGLGLGPLATGALSDAFQGWAADNSLRYALLTMSPGYLVVAWLAWRASLTVERDLATIHTEHPDEPTLSVAETTSEGGLAEPSK